MLLGAVMAVYVGEGWRPSYFSISAVPDACVVSFTPCRTALKER